MSSKMTHLAAFVFGAFAGGAVVWQIARKRNEEEIRSVKETYSRREAIVVKQADAAGDTEMSESAQKRRESVIAYAERLHNEGYLPERDRKEDEASPAGDEPYIISPDKYGEMDGYESISLTFYADGTLADDNDEVVEDIDEIVGSDFRDHFGEYEDDSVFVRNDKRKCDYEILADPRPYSDILKVKPYLRRGE